MQALQSVERNSPYDVQYGTYTRYILCYIYLCTVANDRLFTQLQALILLTWTALLLQEDGTATNSVSHVVVHPLVVLSVLDHHTRRQEADGRVIGTLLGRRDGNKVRDDD